MRYYEVYMPDEDEPGITTNIRRLRDLPQGTRIVAIVTDRDGSLIDNWDVPVENGRPVVSGRGKQRPSYT